MFRSDEFEQVPDDLVPDDLVPPATAASWRTAEAELFTSLLSRPDVYQGAIALVGATVDRLRPLGPTTRALLDAATTITTVVAAARVVDRSAADRIDPDLVGRAALALRHREIMVEQAAERRLSLLADARATTAGWVVLEETGTGPATRLPPIAGWRRTRPPGTRCS
jgi:hypothetical protein